MESKQTKSAFEKWVESEYGDPLMVPSGAVAAWNAAVAECMHLVDQHLQMGERFSVSEMVRQIAALTEDFHSEGD